MKHINNYCKKIKLKKKYLTYVLNFIYCNVKYLTFISKEHPIVVYRKLICIYFLALMYTNFLENTSVFPHIVK